MRDSKRLLRVGAGVHEDCQQSYCGGECGARQDVCGAPVLLIGEAFRSLRMLDSVWCGACTGRAHREVGGVVMLSGCAGRLVESRCTGFVGFRNSRGILRRHCGRFREIWIGHAWSAEVRARTAATLLRSMFSGLPSCQACAGSCSHSEGETA